MCVSTVLIFILQDSLYLYGGVHKTVTVKDLWKYNITSKAWTKLQPGPYNISGHTVHVVDSTMIIIFGYSPDYGYSNKILEYNFSEFSQQFNVEFFKKCYPFYASVLSNVMRLCNYASLPIINHLFQMSEAHWDHAKVNVVCKTSNRLLSLFEYHRT